MEKSKFLYIYSRSLTYISLLLLLMFMFVYIFYSKKREAVPELAPMLWHSFGTITALLQEIINIYSAINPPSLTVSIFFFLTHYCILYSQTYNYNVVVIMC